MSNLGIEDQIVSALRQVIRRVDLHSMRLVGEYGLTGPQLATLQEAARLNPVSAGALARAVSLSQPTVTGILTRLEKQGLVERSRGETDRRTVTVKVTRAGRSMLARAPSLLQEEFRHELSRLEQWEQLMILSNLQRIAVMMGADSLSTSPYLVSGAIGANAEPTRPLEQDTVDASGTPENMKQLKPDGTGFDENQKDSGTGE